MTRAIFLAALVLILAGLAAVHNRQPNAGLPIVQSSAPKHGFVCVPAFPPRLGPVRKQEVV